MHGNTETVYKDLKADFAENRVKKAVSKYRDMDKSRKLALNHSGITNDLERFTVSLSAAIAKLDSIRPNSRE